MVQSLVNLKRVHDAQDEARAMVRKHVIKAEKPETRARRIALTMEALRSPERRRATRRR